MPPVARAQLLPGMGDGGEMTASAERRLGDQIAREIYRDTDYIDDPVIVEYVQDIWQRLLAAARVRGELTPELDERFAWQIFLGRDSTINAFALPGGYLGLNLGLVAIIGSRDELATVLGHELSHVTQRHIARIMSRDAKQMPLMIAAMVIGMLAAMKARNGDAGNAMLMGSQAYAMQSQLAFSREMEREADRVGFGVMTQAGYDPRGAEAMFEKLQFAARLNDNASYPYLRSHPMDTERIADMQGRFQFRDMNAATASTGAMSTRAASVPMTPGLPLVMDHAMISARARVLTRPGVDVLRQWVEAGSGSDFTKSTPAQQAGLLYAAAFSANELKDFKASRALSDRLVTRTAGDASASRLARLLAIEIELDAGNPAKAASLLNAKAKDRPEMLLAVQAAVATRNPAPMVPVLRDYTALQPRDATAWRALSSLYNAQDDPVRAIRADAEANVANLDYAGARDRYKAAQELSRNLSARGAPNAVDHYEASIMDTRARAVDALVKHQAEEPPLK
ncbi:M48 family metalloprotease [Variovorax sp. PAMC28562]|uniref:M48 family metalloprotease n=1 Tax=Variovorax sp. PAMC28562 TaxID=2762323 RepID=UPI003965AF07